MKENKKEPKKEKTYYLVQIEANVPAILYYKVFADSVEEAEFLIKNKQPSKIEYKINKRKNLLLKIYKFGTSMLHKVKSLI